MATNYLPQSNPQPWSWEADMDSRHHFQQEEDEAGEREHMFEKPLTPSDVGKLNRLVIPKQHAERHFPVAGESGLLLSFHDESGKEWRFRYSYWTSSQSYVLTKGWSRFVKEKRLDAGDVVLFQRRRRDHLLYIGSRRRGELRAPPGWGPGCYAAAAEAGTPSGFYINPMLQQEFNLQGNQSETTSARTGISPGNPKRLRLFGVNLDCGPGV